MLKRLLRGASCHVRVVDRVVSAVGIGRQVFLRAEGDAVLGIDLEETAEPGMIAAGAREIEPGIRVVPQT